MGILLSDEEIDKVIIQNCDPAQDTKIIIGQIVDASAKAQLKKVAEWLNKHRAKASAFHTFDTGGVADCVLIKVEDWQALLKEVE